MNKVCTIDDIIHTMQSNHSVVYKPYIKKAFSFAEEKHKGVLRKSGEAYINHPLRVAHFVASWGLESDSVIAALLHDVVEDCDVTVEDIGEMFNENIAKLVDSVTSIDCSISEAEKSILSKEDIDRMSEVKLIENMNRKALLIKIADRLDNLYTIGCFPPNKQIRKARETREIIIPLAEMAKAYYLVDELQNLCIRIEHKDRYDEISEAYQLLLLQNQLSSSFIIDRLNSVISDLSKLNDLSIRTGGVADRDAQLLSRAISKFECKKRSVASLYRQTVKILENCNQSLRSLFTKELIPLYDMTFVIKDAFLDENKKKNAQDVFFSFYDKYLIGLGLEIIEFGRTSDNNSTYILLMDEMENRYRVFVRSELDYVRYRIGDIVDEMDDFNFKGVDPYEPSGFRKKKIKVYKRDGSEMFIDDGATVLDFAFAIHTNIGLHFEYATIDGNPERLGPHVRLNEGDKVVIHHNLKVTPSITWFRHVKTSNAINHLIAAIDASNKKKENDPENE
ncbi:MAG: HD domain-containing protein [Clostridiales bacterium]|nr:HD domain-containing protein [Clostridiales bacterium]